MSSRRIACCAAHPDHFWLQHHSGIFHSTDAAKTWKRITTADPSDFGFAVVVHPQDPLTAWFVPGVKDDRRLPVDAAFCAMGTRDGGQSFEPLRNGLPQLHAYHLVYRHCLDIASDGRTLAFGSTTAAPVFGQIASAAIVELGIQPASTTGGCPKKASN